MSYEAVCEVCGCSIFMADKYDESDEHFCEECRSDGHGYPPPLTGEERDAEVEWT